jgi:hypothetical protein
MSARSWPRVGSGIVPSNPPIGSTSWPVAKMNTAATAEVWAAAMSGSPSAASISRRPVTRWAWVSVTVKASTARTVAGRSNGVSRAP